MQTTPNIPKRRVKSQAKEAKRSLYIKTKDRGTIRIIINTDNVPSSEMKHKETEVPMEVEICLRQALGNQTDPLTKAPVEIPARWTNKPETPGFYVRWCRKWGMSEVYYPGEDVPGTFELLEAEGTKFFGPFHLPL
jgi:hypothetical protein